MASEHTVATTETPLEEAIYSGYASESTLGSVALEGTTDLSESLATALTPPELAERWGVSETLVATIVKRFRTEHPELEFIHEKSTGASGKGTRRVYKYTPDQIAQMEEEGGFGGLPPEDAISIEDLAKQLGVKRNLLLHRINDFSEQYPQEKLLKYKVDGNQRRQLHLLPDQVSKLEQHIQALDEEAVPEGLMTAKYLAEKWGVNEALARRITLRFRERHPDEEFCAIKSKSSKAIFAYTAEQVVLMEEESQIISEPPENTKSISEFADEISRNRTTVASWVLAYVKKNPNQELVRHRSKLGNAKEIRLTEEQMSVIKADNLIDVEPPEGAKSTNELSELWGVKNTRDIVREFFNNNPDQPRLRFKIPGVDKPVTFLTAEQIEMVGQPNANPPEGSMTVNELMSYWGLTRQDTAMKIVREYRKEHPDEQYYFAKTEGSTKRAIYLTPEQVANITATRGLDVEAPEGSMSLKELSDKWGVSVSTVYDRVMGLTDEYPDQRILRFYMEGTAKKAIYLTPEQISLLEQDGRLLERERQENEKSLLNYLSSVAENGTVEAQEFQRLLQLFGAENAIDILFQHRPEYQKVSLPFAKRVIGDYLGEFLVVRGDLQLDKLEMGVQYLSDPNLKEGLREVIKNDCLRSYNQLRREGLVDNDFSTLQTYIAELRMKTASYSTPELAEVLNEVEEYYKALFEVIQIPDNVVEELEPGRLFPDINQRINILELMGKQKMLIADEMGVGKSASAILAKESLGVKQALVVVPSNVIEVWQKYLSDYKNGDGSAKGYFKEGQAPNVLIINNGLDTLKDLDLSEYDYVLVSQERLNDSYMGFLGQLDYDMLIVDEAHKLKNITSGKRADNLVKLAEKIEGDDKYLALLSGTPIPNHVGDVAMVLKLLYPEKFQNVANKDLTRQILDGDVLDLRSLLVPRMQMKSLAESIEMPTLHEELHAIQMTEEERNAYEVLLEEDELTASQKLQILRQFALNPQIFEMTPGFQSSKLKAVGESLRTTFADKNKVVMFVNGYIDGVIRGDNTIFDGLELPEGVETYVIDGKVPKARRLEIQKLLQEQSDRKMLLAVSGQTADVGVDFSGAEELYFYNEPWTEYDKRQQQGRVYRPGLRHDLVSHTFYVEGSVEEGIHKYIGYKYTAVEKLLRGIPLSELEREMLRDDEKQVDPNLEVNPTLAEHYLSQWHRMLKIYSYVKGIGEKDFISFLGKYGREYAECYTDLGSRSYQANVGRLAGTTIDALAKSKKQDPQFVRILDVASGPEMLKSHIGEEYQDQVVSVDINPHHFEQVDEKRRVGSFLDLPVANSTVDYANLSLALHYTKLSLRQGVYEPVKVFQELNRVLVNEGVAVINLMHNNDLKDPKLFAQAIEKVGFKIVEGLSGEVSSANNFRSRMLVLQKVGLCTQDTAALVQQLGTPLLHGFKLAKTDVKIKDSRKIVTTFLLDGAKRIKARLNGTDESVLNEEQTTLATMKSLRRKYGSIQNIPKEMIYQSGLARAFTGKTYVLFKSLETGNGAVITR